MTTPLINALEENSNIDLIKLLLENGADPKKISVSSYGGGSIDCENPLSY